MPAMRSWVTSWAGHRFGRLAALYAGVVCMHGLAVAAVLQYVPAPAVSASHPAIEVIVLTAPEPLPEQEPTPEPEPESVRTAPTDPLPAEPSAAPEPSQPPVDLPDTVAIDIPASDATIADLAPPPAPSQAQTQADAAVEVVRRLACLRSGPDRPDYCVETERGQVLAAGVPQQDKDAMAEAWLPQDWARFALPEAPASLEGLRERKCIGRSGVLPGATEANTEYFLDGPGRAVGNAVTADRGIFCD